MANALALKDIKIRGLERANMLPAGFTENSDPEDFNLPVRWNTLRTFANNALSELYDLILDAHEDYLVKPTAFSITMVAGQEQYDLPGDFLKLRQALYNVNGTRYHIRRFNFEDVPHADFIDTVSTTWGWDLKYRLIGTKIWFIPASNLSGSVDLYYIPQYPYLWNDTDKIPTVFPAGWDRYVALDVAIQCLQSENDAEIMPGLNAEKQAQKERIIRILSPRDEGAPEQVVDVTGRWKSARLARGQ